MPWISRSRCPGSAWPVLSYERMGLCLERHSSDGTGNGLWASHRKHPGGAHMMTQATVLIIAGVFFAVVLVVVLLGGGSKQARQRQKGQDRPRFFGGGGDS